MKKVTLVALTLAALISTSGVVFAHDGGGGNDHPGMNTGGGPRRVAILRGAEEVPNLGDPDGAGFAIIRAKPGKQMVCYEIFVSGIAPATLAHIHLGAAGVAGPVVVNFSAPTSGYSKGCVDGLDKELVKNIKNNPGQYYVNVHNADYPGGAVRGQLFQSPMMDERENEE